MTLKDRTGWIALSGDPCPKETIPTPSPFKGRHGLAKSSANPVPKFCGSGLREGHDKDLLNGKALFHDEPEKKAREGIGLPRPGARLDQVHAPERALNGVKWFECCHGAFLFTL